VREADPDFHSHSETLLGRLAPGPRDGAAAGLQALLAAAPDDPLLADEVERSAAAVVPPPGWSYHWRRVRIAGGGNR
jgi:hypothetical protein